MTPILPSPLHKPATLCEPSERRLQEAERHYHDCLARFGHASAEAYVAERFYLSLRHRLMQHHAVSDGRADWQRGAPQVA